MGGTRFPTFGNWGKKKLESDSADEPSIEDLQPMEVVQSAMVVVEDAPPVEQESNDSPNRVEEPSEEVSEAVEENISEDKADIESE